MFKIFSSDNVLIFQIYVLECSENTEKNGSGSTVNHDKFIRGVFDWFNVSIGLWASYYGKQHNSSCYLFKYNYYIIGRIQQSGVVKILIGFIKMM